MSKVNELLSQLDEAFDEYERKSHTLAELRQTAADELKAKQSELDALKSRHDGYIGQAEHEADDARIALERLRGQVNERIGSVTGLGTDPRVSVK